MKARKRNQIIIGVLCCLLVFTGLGYGVLNSVLTINSRANITSDFNIHFLTETNETTSNGVTKKGITLIDYNNSTSSNTIYNTTVNNTLAATMESSTEVDQQDSTLARFSAVLQKPTDYATFTAIAKNYGTIKGIISSINIVSTPSQELTTWLNTNGGTYSDYFEITTTAQINTSLDPSEEYEFAITVRFKDSATKLPQGALNNEITITYVQDNGQTYYEPSTKNIAWKADENGMLLSYDSSASSYDANGYLQVPALDDDGRPIRYLSTLGFAEEYNAARLTDVNGLMVFAIYNEDDYQAMKDALEYYYGNTITVYKASEKPQNLDIVAVGYLDPVTLQYNAGSQRIQKLDLTNATNLVEIKPYTFLSSPLTDIKLGNTITKIGDSAFQDTNLSSVVIPSSITEIGNGAFGHETNNQSTKLISVDFSHATGLTTIGVGSFDNNNLSSLDFSGATNLVSIGNYAFQRNNISTLSLNGLTHLTSIGDYAFRQNSLTGTLVIPSSIVSIGEYAFATYTDDQHKNQIQTLNLSSATSLTTISDGAFYGNAITSITIPSNLETIGGWAFYNNRIISLNLSNATSLTTIGNSAFWLNGLTSLDLSSATSLATLGDNAFYRNRIQTVTLPGSITSIGDDAFGYQDYDMNNPDTPLSQIQLVTINVPMSKATFENRVSGNNWYSDGGSRPGFQLIYTDYTCDYNSVNCVTN